jgi:hypothetical protein
MDPINRLNRMVETLRQQMAESAKRLDTSKTPSGETRSQNRSGRLSLDELRRRIYDRVQAIEPDTPDRGRRARRIFLESVLAWEFGDELLLDSQLDRLIDNLQQTFESDPEIDAQFRDLMANLSQR